MKTLVRGLLLGLVLATMGTGCSSWRYRGFLDETTTVSVVTPKKTYRLTSVKFERLDPKMSVAPGFVSDTAQWFANWAYAPYVKHIEGLEHRGDKTYIVDIAKATAGFCTTDTNAQPVAVRIVPKHETKYGFLSIIYPFMLSVGIVPSAKTRDVPFDVIVEFPGQSVAPRVTPAVVRMDSRFALSPLGTMAYPETVGAEAAGQIAGSFVLDERNDLLREVFVKTVASALRQAIAAKDRLQVEPRKPLVLDGGEQPLAFGTPTVLPDSPKPTPPPKKTPVVQSKPKPKPQLENKGAADLQVERPVWKPQPTKEKSAHFSF